MDIFQELSKMTLSAKLRNRRLVAPCTNYEDLNPLVTIADTGQQKMLGFDKYGT